jgi:hypothetical protein
MKRLRKRLLAPSLLFLEARRLLSGTPAALWIGQDGHDFAGGATHGIGNGVQDVHVVLSGLPVNNAVSSVLLLGFGGGGWNINSGPYSSVYSGYMARAAGSTLADLYLDPYVPETGRHFDIVVTYDDQSSVVVGMDGGKADPNLWMPGHGVSAQWVGQDGSDLTGPNPGVGPDGIQDVHMTLGNLLAGTAVTGISVVESTGHGWAFGLNPTLLDNAEFLLNSADASKGDLYFSPDIDLAGQALTVTVMYADGKTVDATVTAGHTDPNLAMPAPVPVSVIWDMFHAQWLGQDGLALVGAGDVHLALNSLPAGRTVVSTTLSDQAGIDWAYTRPGSGVVQPDPSALPLGFQPGTVATRADLGFPPVRNESGATLTLTLLLDDGTRLATHVTGGVSDPGLRAPNIAATSVVAHPGDDLNALANNYGTVRLISGLYPMNQPLVLNHPVTIIANPGATLLFFQNPADPAWTAAIKVRASHTTLNGFAVRFAGPVRWNTSVSYGPAIVGTTDNLDPWSADPLVALAFTRLDLQAPPASTSWEEAPHTFRLVSASDGQVISNVIKGGTTEFIGGPWQITGNTYLGPVPGTFTYGAFAGHYTHDVTISYNTIAPTGPSGKTWRFLVMTQSGIGDKVMNNTVVGVGPMDSDTVVNPNASEIILTEAYRLHYEGLPSAVSADGLIVQIPAPQAGPARTGDVVAILSGPLAGQWRTIAQVLSPSTYLLDSPLTPGKFAISIATGFVNETYQGNTIDARGSSTALDFVLAGNQFGAKVVGNHWIGGKQAFLISAYPSETPNIWGWTRAPILGVTVQGNTVEDTQLGGLLDVQQSPYTKSDAGRVYFSGSFLNNSGVWSGSYLSARSQSGVTSPPMLVTVGDALSADPGELVLAESGNTVSGPSSVVSGATFSVVSGTVNGVADRNVGLVLPGRSLSAGIRVAAQPASAAEIRASALPSRPATGIVTATSSPATVFAPWVGVSERRAPRHPAGPRRAERFLTLQILARRFTALSVRVEAGLHRPAGRLPFAIRRALSAR